MAFHQNDLPSRRNLIFFYIELLCVKTLRALHTHPGVFSYCGLTGHQVRLTVGGANIRMTAVHLNYQNQLLKKYKINILPHGRQKAGK